MRRIFVKVDPYLGELYLHQITGDVIWKVIEGEQKKGNLPATINRYLCVVRALLRMARDEWQWIDSFPKIRLLTGKSSATDGSPARKRTGSCLTALLTLRR